MVMRKLFVLMTPDNQLISDFNKTTTDVSQAVSWLSEAAAIEAIRRSWPLLRHDVRLTQIEVPLIYSGI